MSISNGPGVPDYHAIARERIEHARQLREQLGVGEYSPSVQRRAEQDGSAAISREVERQAEQARAAIGTEGLRRAARYRARKWEARAAHETDNDQRHEQLVRAREWNRYRDD